MTNYWVMPAHADNPNEYFDTYSATGEKLAPQPRAHVHASGIWHKAVNVFVFRPNGNLILQQRAAAKSVCPLAWDLSVAEHLQLNERWQDAAHRGVREELGVDIAQLEPWGEELAERHDDPARGIHNYEFQRCFRGTTSADLKIDVGEVVAVRELSLRQLADEIATDQTRFTPWLLLWLNHLNVLPERTAD